MANLANWGVDLTYNNLPNSEFDPVPEGTYNVIVSGAEVKETKTGGAMIVASFKVQGGSYNGSLIRISYNVVNTNATAVTIGKSNIKKLLKASGNEGLNLMDSDQLVGLTCQVKVVVKTSGEYSNNEIKEYLPLSGVRSGGVQGAVKTTPTQAPQNVAPVAGQGAAGDTLAPPSWL